MSQYKTSERRRERQRQCRAAREASLTPEQLAERRQAKASEQRQRRVNNSEEYLRRDRERSAMIKADPERLERIRAYQKRYRDNHREQVRAYNRGYAPPPVVALRKREYMKTYSRNWNLKRRYGLNESEYQAMLSRQEGVCAICKCPPSGTSKQTSKLKVDHDHDTGTVRALLCHGCNCAIGHARDNPTTLRSAAEYIERFRA